MEVLVGSTFRDRSSSVTPQDHGVSAALSNRIGLRRCGRSPAESSSSVGERSENEEEEDVSSSQQGRWLGSFSSCLEDSLPIKRGLSNHYIGKSKSFGNLMEAASNAKDLEKVESPLNKRRRLLIANKLRRRSSSLSSFNIYSKINPNSMPLLALQESDQDDIDKYNYDDDDDDSSDDETYKLQEKRMKMTNNNNNNNREFMTKSCFSLTSFQDDDR